MVWLTGLSLVGSAQGANPERAEIKAAIFIPRPGIPSPTDALEVLVAVSPPGQVASVRQLSERTASSVATSVAPGGFVLTASDYSWGRWLIQLGDGVKAPLELHTVDYATSVLVADRPWVYSSFTGGFVLHAQAVAKPSDQRVVIVGVPLPLQALPAGVTRDQVAAVYQIDFEVGVPSGWIAEIAVGRSSIAALYFLPGVPTGYEAAWSEVSYTTLADRGVVYTPVHEPGVFLAVQAPR
jgi:hypothetical protein